MNTIVDLEELVISLGLELVFLVQEGRRVHSDDASTHRQKAGLLLVADPLNVEYRQEASNDDNIIPDGASVVSDPNFANIGGGYLDWNDLDIDFANFLNSQMKDKTVQYPSSGSSSSLVRHSPPSTYQTVQMQEAILSPKVLIPSTPTTNIRSLIQRPKIGAGSQRIANLILHTLKCYPLMMLRYNTLPPFIHPGLISSDVEDNHMEPLTNCISLVQMISGGVQGSRKLFWKNVRQECERLFEGHLTLSKWELIAAIQALTIYILMRLDEGEMDYNNFDSLLLTTVIVIATKLSSIDISCNTQSALYNYGLDVGWKDWIFEESRRRISLVYRVVNMLIYFEPAAMCTLQADLILAPLPARKQLWEAPDEFVWKAESKKDPGAQTDFGLTANESSENWEEWCLGMDGFGGLVMLAASLIV
ncbi:hypothetical protein NA56DRAFT_731411 [Hyaloscypha hepaticicola]|uniref:Transcription factor domain-containing protein n=1 Tax=Hyaloscypha hepaticicola TaxID=2082293 RepID=A0A2J6PQ95_9HELO|nr:hypothetical protein NA56DRAFT_731411 [Hyaloscypha hepaticicola]